MTPTLIYDRRIEANRRNAQKSTGPKTAEGKQKSALNARRHHLTGQVSTMTEPDRATYEIFVNNFVDDWKPEGAMEVQLVTRLAHDSWRINRACAIEDNILSIYSGGTESPDDFQGNHPQIDDSFAMARAYDNKRVQTAMERLSLYMQRTQRMVEKNTKMLKEIQAERRRREEQEMEAAKRLQQLNESKGLPYDPKADGFVFSNEEIHTEIDRDNRLKQSADLKMTRQMRRKLARMAQNASRPAAAAA